MNTDDIFIRVYWPEYQKYMDKKGYRANAVVPLSLADGSIPIHEISSEFDSCVLIRKSWLDKQN